MFPWLTQGAEAFVIRNAGGRTEDALRDILVVDSLFGVKDIMVVHHTGISTHSGPMLFLFSSQNR